MHPIPANAQGAEEILRAAKDLFALRGYDAVSISAIAERAGASKANIFHHFGCKESLYLAVMRATTDRVTERFRDIDSSEGEARERIRRAAADFIEFMEEDPDRSRLVLREVIGASDSRGRELADTVFSEEFTTLTRIFERAGAGADADAPPASFHAFLLLASSVMHFHCRRVLRHLPGAEFVDDRERYIEWLSAVLVPNDPAGNRP